MSGLQSSLASKAIVDSRCIRMMSITNRRHLCSAGWVWELSEVK